MRGARDREVLAREKGLQILTRHSEISNASPSIISNTSISSSSPLLQISELRKTKVNIYFASTTSLGYKTPCTSMMSLGEGLTPGAVAWVCIGVYSILDGNINYTLDLVGAAKDAN